jgi:type I restriction enzyme S subunit
VSDLPAGWEQKKIGDVFEFTYGKSLPDRVRSGKGFPVYGSNGIVGHHEKPLTQGETIIIGRKGSVGEVHYSSTPCFPIDTTYYIEQFHDMPARFWYYLLKFSNLGSLNKSTAIPGLNRNDAYDIDIPFPPLNEQKRIADKLDSLLARVDSCQTHLARVPQTLKRFRQSVLAAATSGRLTEDWREENSTQQFEFEYLFEARKRAWETNEIRKQAIKGISPDNNLIKNYPEPVELEDSSGFEKPDNWIFVSTDQITFLITDGKHGDCKNEPNSGYYFLSVKDLYQGNLHYEDARQIRKEDFLEVHYRTNLEKGDVLVTNAGTIGRVAVARDETKASRTTFQKSVAILKPVKEVVLSEYLAMYIESSVARLVEKSSGTAVKNLLLRDLRTITIALPSLEEQAEIVRRVEKLFAYAERLEARYTSASEHVERLTPSLLAKAFRGELVRQE